MFERLDPIEIRYEELTRAMTELNAQAETIHAGSKP